MKFFIPFAENSTQAEEVYEAMMKFAAEQTAFTISSHRIFSISYHHEGKDYYTEVGKIHERDGETVIAIFKSTPPVGADVYLVCSPNRSVLRGEPMLIGEREIKRVTYFES